MRYYLRLLSDLTLREVVGSDRAVLSLRKYKIIYKPTGARMQTVFGGIT